MEIQIIESDHPDGIATRHGDVFSIHGATFTPDRPHSRGWMRCLPSEKRVKPAGEWNHYRVESRDGRVTLAVNGKVVSGGSNCVPRKGYICLESEGSAPDLAARWQPKDCILDCDRTATPANSTLWTERSFRDFQLIVEWRIKSSSANEPGAGAVQSNCGVPLRGSPAAQVRIERNRSGSGAIFAAATPTVKADKPLGQWNRFIITVRGKRLTVMLNDKSVIEDATLPEVPAEGPIALRADGEPI